MGVETQRYHPSPPMEFNKRYDVEDHYRSREKETYEDLSRKQQIRQKAAALLERVRSDENLGRKTYNLKKSYFMNHHHY